MKSTIGVTKLGIVSAILWRYWSYVVRDIHKVFDTFIAGEQMQRTGPVKKQRPDRLARLLVCESVFRPLEERLRKTGFEQREEAGLIAGYVTNENEIQKISV